MCGIPTEEKETGRNKRAPKNRTGKAELDRGTGTQKRGEEKAKGAKGMNYFKEAENILRSYADLKMAIENIERRKTAAALRSAPKEITAADVTKERIDGGGANDTISQYVEVIQLNRLQQETIDEVKYIESIIKQLPDDDREILQMWYVDEMPKAEIMEKIDRYSNRTAYNRRNTAITHFAILYFGAPAL